MKRRLPFVALVLLVLTAPLGGALAAKPAKKPRQPKAVTFEVCRHDCRYQAIQKAVDAAGAYAWKHGRAKVKVAIRPGRYVEGVRIDGAGRHRDFDGMTIEGTQADRERTILEGRNARGSLGAAQNGIEAIDVDDLVLKNLWARNFESDGFFIHASVAEGQHCDGYAMSNLLASGNGSDGLATRGCRGGKMINSAGYRQGGAAFAVDETPCDSTGWNVYDGAPCQSEPQWTLLSNDEGHESAVGYRGTNSKYVRVLESAFFNNGTGILTASLDSEGYEPSGWNEIERDDVFWNNYNPFLAGSAGSAPHGGLGELNGRPLNYPTGVGIALHGSDHTIVRANHVFGNYKWGIATFSGPGETLLVDQGNEAKNVNNEIVENFLGRGGADPNGEYDIWNDATGGGNCWGANSANATFAPGNGKVPPGQIYPVCPQAQIAYTTAKSVNLTAGLQTGLAGTAAPATILGYIATDPPRDQQCSWVRRDIAHPEFQRFSPVELEPRPSEVGCERR